MIKLVIKKDDESYIEEQLNCMEILEAFMKVLTNKRDDFKKAIINIAKVLAEK